jgi:hypothetical protein
MPAAEACGTIVTFPAAGGDTQLHPFVAFPHVHANEDRQSSQGALQLSSASRPASAGDDPDG